MFEWVKPVTDTLVDSRFNFLVQLSTSAVIAIIGFVDSIVAAKENAGKYAYNISPNRELVALGKATYPRGIIVVIYI